MTKYERLLELIARPSDACIICDGQILDGYGYLKWRSRPHRAHRASYEETYGQVPAGMLVCHKCDVRPCVNPRHLFLGTAADNLADMYAKGRQHTPGPRNPARGERCAAAVLSAAQVEQIRSDGRSQRQIARDHEISKSQVGRIKRGASWKHLLPKHGV